MHSPNPLEADGAAIAPAHSKGSIDEPQGHSPFPVVGIGASAGGLEAFQQLLDHLPAETGMAFVLIQHLDPRHESRLADLLSRSTTMPVLEATHGLHVRPDHVYVITPNTSLAIAEGLLKVTPRDGPGLHLPIDIFFRSLAEDQQARAVGVVLSGTGTDGTLGLGEIKAVGGITFAQDERSAKQAGMPRSAVESGSVDFVMTADAIGDGLARVGGHPYLATDAPARVLADGGELYYRRILDAVRAVTLVDFRLYRDTTIKRRIMRRMALHGQESLAEYALRLEGDRPEVHALYHDLLINVTSFFRDPKLFEALQARVFPELAAGKAPSAPLRVWVPGCSSGQEAYSLAIALLEFYDERPAQPPIQIFATDLSDPVSLDKARAGVYPESIEAEVSPERLGRFFHREDHLYRIDKSIRDMCVFARQNVTADPPFSHLDLISCRNLLIYLATPLQKRVMPTFHYALNPAGFLVLGTAESVGEGGDLFEVVDRVNKIYTKKPSATWSHFHFDTVEHRAVAQAAPRAEPMAPSLADYQRQADRILLGQYAPPGVLVNEYFQVVQYRGRTSPYLEPPPGEPTTDLLKLAREGLFLELRSALEEAKQHGRAARREGLRARADGSVREVDVEVLPVRPPGVRANCFLVLFHEVPPSAAAGDGPGVALPGAPARREAPDERELALMRQELAASKEYMQALIEQQDAANEELRTVNEEILSSNEEMQSTNEELETAKEEIQSANEELTTVNEQLQQRNLEISQANADLGNLLSSTAIPVVMVDGDLRIRRFTPPAKALMSLMATDVGRPIIDIVPALVIPDLAPMIDAVMHDAQPREREILDREGRWHSLRVHPYRAADRKIDGAVIVLMDIHQRKQATDALRLADRRKDEFLATLAHELRNPIAPIRNAVEILRRSGDDPEALAQARDVLDRQLRQLSRIVDDLIDVSRIVEQKIDLRPRRVDVAAVVELAVETCRSFVESSHHRLTVTLPPGPLYIKADPARLAQVVVNLLNNAAKFTEPGGQIRLVVATDENAEPPGALYLRVIDTGIGIDGDLMPRVFDLFAQGDQAIERSRGGLGIGLSLVKSLVEMHGGTVRPHSEGAGRGSEFVVRLPLTVDQSPEAAADRAGPAPAASPPPVGRKILVVDDSQDQARSLGTLLRLMGHEVRVAHDGLAALDAAREFLPDVALVDIGLPGISGYEVARAIRQEPQLRSILLVAQTGWGQPDDRRRSADAGFDHHLIKPVEPHQLEAILADLPPADADRPRPADDGPV